MSYTKVTYSTRLIIFIQFCLIIIVYLIMVNYKGIYDSPLVYITNSFIVIFSSYHLLINRGKSYTAKKFFYLFIFFFMGIAPLMQYKMGTETVGGYKISEQSYILTNLIVFFAIVIFEFAYNISYKSIKFNNFVKNFCIKVPVSNFRVDFILIIISFLGLFLTLLYFSHTPLLLIFRGLDGLSTVDQPSNQIYGAIFFSAIRPLPVICFINYLCIGKNKYVKILLFLIMLISCFPSSLARLRVAAYYIPILLILFPRLKKRNNFVKLFILGFLIIFPLFSNFRYWGSDDFKWTFVSYDMFCNMNYDSYQSLAFVFQNDIITYGRQLLVVLFFWVPRTFWPDKPLFSGMTVAHDYNLWFDQISMNYFGEGYINFGLPGVVLFSIFLGYITAKFDKIYWRYNKGNTHTLFAPFYFLFIGVYFFFMRGDLMYGFMFTISLLFDNFLIYKFIKKVLK